MTNFEQSVRDIEGLTDFKLGTLPKWFSGCLQEMLIAPGKNDYSDADLVVYHMDRDWLGEWGKATINGKDVFLFEYQDECAYDELYEPAELAEMLRCGLQMVEMSNRFDVGTTAFFTERRHLIPRRKEAGVALAVSEA